MRLERKKVVRNYSETRSNDETAFCICYIIACCQRTPKPSRVPMGRYSGADVAFGQSRASNRGSSPTQAIWLMVPQPVPCQPGWLIITGLTSCAVASCCVVQSNPVKSVQQATRQSQYHPPPYRDRPQRHLLYLQPPARNLLFPRSLFSRPKTDDLHALSQKYDNCFPP